MNLKLKIITLSAACLLWVTTASAYKPTFNETTIPYELAVIDPDIEREAGYLGELNGYPQMYEFAIGADRELVLELKQLETDNIIPFSLIVVRENNNKGGVAEVGRLKANDAEWSRVSDAKLGMTFLQSKTFSAEIGAGIYRVEVSTPENFGKYLLVVGDKSNSVGYFETLGNIRDIQKFFGKSMFSLIKSSYYYYPIGIILLMVLFWFTKRYRVEIQNKFARK